jgi:hypothetical protein
MSKPPSGSCQNPKCGVWRQSLHRDHIVPRVVKEARGENPDLDNIQLLCANCHEDKTREDWKNPEFRAAHKIKARAARLQTTPEKEGHRTVALRQAMGSPKTLALLRKVMPEVHNRPEVRLIKSIVAKGSVDVKQLKQQRKNFTPEQEEFRVTRLREAMAKKRKVS